MSSQDQGIVTRNRMAYEENLPRVKKVKIISIINNIVLCYALYSAQVEARDQRERAGVERAGR